MQVSFILYLRIKLVFRASTKVETVTASEEEREASAEARGTNIYDDSIPDTPDKISV